MFNLMRAENFESRAETRRELLLENLDDVFRVNKGPVLLTEKKDNVEIHWRTELPGLTEEIARIVR
ncbi:MAG: hypothetical protein DME87_12440 [Verrucomicrobia bacterium]|nr:MAG: hypothetical protein DME87_12440 [Verrucomicrobiota bacterium]